ncbi:nucleotidyltransferase substrate binding protein [Aeromonas media]|uniref:Nucleotidyltransferase substrate binding protein n=1 Tax=Aeromonas media TaxID=651 RepID=A0AAW5RTB4_AERME|nr:nucleotidyltransferase substrate binding protein [Aeromonas media]MCV3290956.1 nucleotidyltransferase substrate binding protein [Aeromonas media]
MMIDYSKLQKSLKHLEMQFQNYSHSQQRPELTTLDREGIAESTIQRFETCYDALWKLLKRYLITELGLPDVPNSPKPIFRLAGENLLLVSPVEHWMRYADARIGTAHDYDGEKATLCLALVPAFIADATALYQTMSKERWE